MKLQHFHTELPSEKLMLSQIEWGVQNGSLLQFFENLISVKESLIISWFNMPIAQIYMFIFSVSALVLLDGVFSLSVSLSDSNQVEVA